LAQVALLSSFALRICRAFLDKGRPVMTMIRACLLAGSVAVLTLACSPSMTNLCMKVNVFAGETGYYELAGYTGSSPDITVQIGKTYVFNQNDASNWYHPVGFAYVPDGAHGLTWGGEEQPEVEGAGELLYKINGAATTCPDAGDTGLDCYEPEFFYPRGDWMAKSYTAELTITQAMADRSHGGVIYYFCHIHSKMSGKIIIQNADGSPVTQADGTALANPTPFDLYEPTVPTGVDVTCGTSGLEPYSGGGASACAQRFLCGTLDTEFEQCLQAIDCKMNKEMKSDTSADHGSKVAVFMQQMIPHHENAVNMAKLLLKQVPAATIANALDGDLIHIVHGIINTQNFQIHQFRNFLGGSGYSLRSPGSPTPAPASSTPAPFHCSACTRSSCSVSKRCSRCPSCSWYSCPFCDTEHKCNTWSGCAECQECTQTTITTTNNPCVYCDSAIKCLMWSRSCATCPRCLSVKMETWSAIQGVFTER